MEKINIQLPQYWKKKKLNPEFIKELESTAKSDPFTKDEFGEYRFGTFLNHWQTYRMLAVNRNAQKVISHFNFDND